MGTAAQTTDVWSRPLEWLRDFFRKALTRRGGGADGAGRRDRGGDRHGVPDPVCGVWGGLCADDFAGEPDATLQQVKSILAAFAAAGIREGTAQFEAGKRIPLREAEARLRRKRFSR